MDEKRQRIQIIDALRGLSLVLMVIHHFLLDLVVLCGAPGWLFSNPVFDILHYIFAGAFVFLAGVSCRLSRSNLKRGIKCLAVAMVITAATSLPIIDSPILFGVLHLLGCSMLIFALTHAAWDAIPRRVMPFLYTALIAASAYLVERTSIGDAAKYLFMFGWTPKGFYSADYFPLFPWFFVFLLGTWFGLPVVERRLPERFYTFNCPVLPEIGRRSLLIYVLHQPVLYAAIYAVKFILNK